MTPFYYNKTSIKTNKSLFMFVNQFNLLFSILYVSLFDRIYNVDIIIIFMFLIKAKCPLMIRRNELKKAYVHAYTYTVWYGRSRQKLRYTHMSRLVIKISYFHSAQFME